MDACSASSLGPRSTTYRGSTSYFDRVNCSTNIDGFRPYRLLGQLNDSFKNELRKIVYNLELRNDLNKIRGIHHGIRMSIWK